GASVIAVDSAKAAFRSIKSSVPDVVVSDIGMPGEDGHAFMRKLRARANGPGARVPAIALTAYATGDDCARAVAAGFDRHVAKPVAPAEIVEAVASLAARRSVVGPEA
ncbi:MAG TPA: response regulator, partial [Vicinamibacterales bacterium]|nr:response regulator [Vicinamibacterales bacterium]